MPSLPGRPLPRRRKTRPELVIGGIVMSTGAGQRRHPHARAEHRLLERRPAAATRRFWPSAVKRSCGRDADRQERVAGLAAVRRLPEPAQADGLAVGRPPSG